MSMKSKMTIYPYRDAQSDTSSISQNSYDPSQPMFSGMSSEIPETDPIAADEGSGGIVLLSAKTRPEAGKNTKFETGCFLYVILIPFRVVA